MATPKGGFFRSELAYIDEDGNGVYYREGAFNSDETKPTAATGMPELASGSTIYEPDTGNEFAYNRPADEWEPKASMKDSVDLLRVLVNGQVFDNWGAIREVVRQGRAQDYFNIGDQLEVSWVKGGTTYKLPFDVVSFDSVIKEGETDPVPGLWLESHYAMDGVQFDASEAIYVADAALPAGTYNFTIGTNWGTHCVAGKVYQFTTTKEIPAGGQIMVGKNNDWYTWGAPDQDPSTWRVHTFSSNAGTTPLESNLTLTEGSGGTALGSLASDVKYSANGINNLQRAGYGYNRWSMSAMRQYLNSEEAAGGWWLPKNPFDRAPQQLSTLAGFLSGFGKDFLDAVGKIKVTTALNTVSDTDIGASEDTYDKFFLASLEQEYIVPQAAGVEGAYWPYWKDRLGTDTPQAQYSTDPRHIRYGYDAKTSSRYCRLRSADRGSAYDTWYVHTSGYVGYNYAAAAYRGCPACVIC